MTYHAASRRRRDHVGTRSEDEARRHEDDESEPGGVRRVVNAVLAGSTNGKQVEGHRRSEGVRASDEAGSAVPGLGSGGVARRNLAPSSPKRSWVIGIAPGLPLLFSYVRQTYEPTSPSAIRIIELTKKMASISGV